SPLSTMPDCGLSCAIPSCASEPTVGFGRHGIYGHSGIRYGALGFGGSELANNLGILDGVTPSCINQVPSSEVVIQPPPFSVTIPGPILAASGEPVAVGGNAPCSLRGVGIAGGFGNSGFGLGYRGIGLGYQDFCGQRVIFHPASF
ncbi:hypothetical protein JD844_025953, partial [Phrynosoma platyrhinos]